MTVRPETNAANVKSAIISTVCWLVIVVPFCGGVFACSAWLGKPWKPFATAGECHRVLARYDTSQVTIITILAWSASNSKGAGGV